MCSWNVSIRGLFCYMFHIWFWELYCHVAFTFHGGSVWLKHLYYPTVLYETWYIARWEECFAKTRQLSRKLHEAAVFSINYLNPLTLQGITFISVSISSIWPLELKVLGISWISAVIQRNMTTLCNIIAKYTLLLV